MAAVYREARAGTIASQDATRFVFVLAQIGKLIELSELERRLSVLEARENDHR